MGFDECDYQSLIDNDFEVRSNHNFFAREKLIKLAGNSIVVNVLEAIFEQVLYIKDYILCPYPKQKKVDTFGCTFSANEKLQHVACSQYGHEA